MNLLSTWHRDPNGGETAEETLARLRSGTSVVTQEMLQPPRWIRIYRLVVSALVSVAGVGALLWYLGTGDLESSEGRVIAAIGAVGAMAGVLSLIGYIRNRVLLSPEGVKVRRTLRERTIPWNEIRQIRQERGSGEQDKYRLALTTTGRETIRLPGFLTNLNQPPPWLVAAEHRIQAWRRRYDPSLRTPERAPAGWYPDITNGGHLRYWDGAVWTDQFENGATEPTPNSPQSTPT